MKMDETVERKPTGAAMRAARSIFGEGLMSDQYIEQSASIIDAEFVPLVELCRRFIRYHDGVARWESADTVQECPCSICTDARATLDGV